MHCRYFDAARKDNHSSFPTPTVVGGRRPPPFEICAQNDPPPSKNAFQRDIDGVRMLPRSPQTVAQKRYLFKKNKIQLSNKVCYKVFCV